MEVGQKFKPRSRLWEIVRRAEAGENSSTIADALRLHRTTVSKAVKHHRETGEALRPPPDLTARAPTAVTPAQIELINRNHAIHPSLSATTMIRRLCLACSKDTVLRVWKRERVRRYIIRDIKKTSVTLPTRDSHSTSPALVQLPSLVISFLQKSTLPMCLVSYNKTILCNCFR